MAAAQLPLRLERLVDSRSAHDIRQCVNQYVRAALQVVDRNFLVDVVSRIRLPGEPHAEGDRVRESFRVGSAAGDGGLRARAGRLRVIVEETTNQFRVRIEG